MKKTRLITGDRIEEIKNVLIVVLLFIAVLLLHFFWNNTRLEIGTGEENIKKTYSTRYYMPTLEEIMKPDEINIGYGEKDYRKIGAAKFEKVWRGESEEISKGSVLGRLRAFGSKGDVLVEEIEKGVYEKINNEKTLNVIMPYSLRFLDLCKIYDLKTHASYDKINSIKQISYTAAAKNSLFLYDEKNDKYYRLISSKKDIGFEKIINKFSGDRKNISYELGTITGSESSVLIPLEQSSLIEKFRFKNDIDLQQEYATSELGKIFFGESLEFIRKMTQSGGKIVYMYGYGKQVLSVEQNGKLIYTEVLPQEYQKNVGFAEALESAVKFVGVHRGWQDVNGEAGDIFLKSVDYDEKFNRYKFGFGMRFDGRKVYYTEGEVTTVVVEKGYVTEYQKQLFAAERNNKEENIETKKKEVYEAIDLLTENYKYMWDIASRNTRGKPNPENFEYVVSKITGMEMGYLIKFKNDLEEANQYSRPVWKVSIGKSKFFFDLYTGEKAGYKIEE